MDQPRSVNEKNLYEWLLGNRTIQTKFYWGIKNNKLAENWLFLSTFRIFIQTRWWWVNINLQKLLKKSRRLYFKWKVRLITEAWYFNSTFRSNHLPPRINKTQGVYSHLIKSNKNLPIIRWNQK